MKKLKYLLLLPFLALTSCGERNIPGTYGFALGNQGGAHFGVYATLSDKYYVDPETGVTDKVKKDFLFKLDMPESATTLSTLDTSNEESITYSLSDTSLNDGTIKGYYYLGKEEDLGLKVYVGSSVIDQIFGEEKQYSVSPLIVECIICAHINSEGNFNMRVPVSLEDLQMQLIWYGYWIDINSSGVDVVDLFENDGKKYSVGHWPVIGVHFDQREKLIGTIPSGDDLTEVKNFVTNHSTDLFHGLIFRAHHVINLGLSKM